MNVRTSHFLLQLFICSLAFGTFTVELELPQNRLQLSFILLLTTITFKFVVSQTLPRISYLTYLVRHWLISTTDIPHLPGKTSAHTTDTCLVR